MKTASWRLVGRLRRLCRLEFEPSALRNVLTDRERRHAIELLRRGIPISVLGHHDRMLQRGRASIAGVESGKCTACRRAVSAGSLARMRAGCGLELCDHCASFLFLDQAPGARSGEPAARRALAVSRRHAHR